MDFDALVTQILTLSAQFSEFKFWLVAGLALLGVVSAVIVAAASAYIKSHVQSGILEGIREAQESVTKTAELEKKIFLMEQRISNMEKANTKEQWHDLTITAPIDGPVTGFGKYLKTQNSIVMLYIDTYCDSSTHPIATLPEGFRPRRDVEISIRAVDVFNQLRPAPIRGYINSQGQIYVNITSKGMQCPINALFIAEN